MKFFGRFAPSTVLAFTLLLGLIGACGRSGLGLRDPDEDGSDVGGNGGTAANSSGALNGGGPSSGTLSSSKP